MLSLRPFQIEALRALSEPIDKETHHVLCIAPTGSGKSLIYEKASQWPQTRMVLITPLVALARQQYAQLKKLRLPVELGIGGTNHIPPAGKCGIWIMSPEMLHHPARQAALHHWKPNFLVVDECHCLWEWGESFRPAFTLIPKFIQTYCIRRSLWLTATLPPEAKAELKKALSDSLIELGEFNLPQNFNLKIKKIPWQDRPEVILQSIAQQDRAGIIFTATRNNTLRLARLLELTGKKRIIYHGGLSKEERQNVEKQIELQIPEVIVATSAFGMGMNYSHLNYVILSQAPTSLLSLVQSIGRVGRNPKNPSHALVLWHPDDFKLLEWTLKDSEKRKSEIMSLLDFLDSKTCRTRSLRTYFDPKSQTEACLRCDICLTI